MTDRRGTQAWRINADGSDLRQLTSGSGSTGSAIPSRDGTQLVTTLQGTEHLAFFDVRDFSKPRHVAMPAVEPRGGGLQMRDWSPDGRTVLFNVQSPAIGGGPNLWSYDVVTSATRRVADCGAASWMKDSRRIVCLRGAGFGSPARLAVVDVSSGLVKELELGSPGGGQGGVQLAADDTQLFFMMNSLAADIWVARFEQPARSQ